MTTRLALVAVLASLVAPAPGSAQEGGAPTADVPKGPAALIGVVLHADRPDAVGNVDVVLYALPKAGAPGLRRTRTGADGRFRFDGISNQPGDAYIVGARFDGVAYPGSRIQFRSGEIEREVEIRIADSSDAAADIARVEILEHSLRVAWIGNQIGVSELVKLRNPGTRAVFVAAGDRRPDRSVFHSVLPEGLSSFTTPMGIPPEGLVRDGSALRFFGPVYPGEQQLQFGYTVEATSGDTTLRRVLGNATTRVRLHAPASMPKLRVEGLEVRDDGLEDGVPHRLFVGEDLKPGSEVVLSVTLPESVVDPEALSIRETQLFLELDAAAIQVRERYSFEVAGDSSLVGRPGEPLLRVQIPEGASDVRFGSGASPLGLRPDGVGSLAVFGPLAPGASELEILYRLPTRAGTIELSRSFPRALPLLSVFIADTGVLVDAPRLHRRRPVATSDLTYLKFEAFQVEAGEIVAIHVEPLGNRSALTPGLSLGLLLAAAGLALAFVLRPVWNPSSDVVPQDAERDEREAIYAAIHDLDHDFETGKVEPTDYAGFREELHQRALASLREERSGEETFDSSPSSPPEARDEHCPSCRHDVQPEDRFCSACGATLAPSAEKLGRSA